MLCVAIGRGRHKQLLAEHKHLAEQGAKLIEMRLDYIARDVNLKRLLEGRPSPVIATCRRECDGGRWKGTEDARLMLLRSAIVEGVEYIDLEEDIADKVPRYGATKRIISMHDFEKTPDDLETIHARLKTLDADVVKLSTMANTPHDNLRMLQLIQKADIPTVGMCMGEIGSPSRILAGKFGSPWTYCTFHHERSLAPGQLSFDLMKNGYRYESITADTKIFGVIGDPIAQTLSPTIHNAGFSALGLDMVYLPFRIPSESLDQFMSDCPQLGITGLSVTIPHKEAVVKHCSQVDGTVRGTGAVNTIVFKEGQALGFNTDYRAAMSSLDMHLAASGRRHPLTGRTAIVLGAGGAARALAFGLSRRGADVVVSGRTHDRALALARTLGCRAVEWESREKIKADVVVNTTPVGMHPNVDETPYEAHSLRPNAIVFDTVYNPRQTLLYKQAKDRGCKVISGVDMFVGQAALQFEHFTGQPAPMEVMSDAMKRAIGAAKY